MTDFMEYCNIVEGTAHGGRDLYPNAGLGRLNKLKMQHCNAEFFQKWQNTKVQSNSRLGAKNPNTKNLWKNITMGHTR